MNYIRNLKKLFHLIFKNTLNTRKFIIKQIIMYIIFLVGLG
jgi:hypothetical protein